MAIQRIVISLMALGLLAGCGGGSKGSAPAVTVTMLATPPGPLATVGNPPKDSFQFSARVEGSGDTVVMWSIKENGGGTIDTIGRYLAPRTEGQYTVVASARADSSKSAQATVTVMDPPRITLHPASMVTALGASVTFTLAASGQQLAFQWYRQGAAIPGATAQAFVINSIAGGDAGIPFHCVVSNPVGTATSTPATITVQPPVITAHPASVTVAEGSGATFTVGATGGGLAYQWTRNQAPVPGATQAQLALGALGLQDSGSVFRCVVSNPSGTVTSDPATLTVKSVVAITSFTASAALVPFGQPATLNWAIQGQPDAVQVNGINLLGAVSTQVTPRLRERFTLTVSGFNTVTRDVEIAARGLDAFAGDLGGNGNLDGLGSEARLGMIYELRLRPDGSVLLVDDMAGAIRQVDAAGQVTTLAGGSVRGFQDGVGRDAKFSSIAGSDLDALGNLYVCDWGNNRIRKVSPSGVVSTVAGPGLGNPTRVAVTPGGTLLVATQGNTILKIPPGGFWEVLAGQWGVAGGEDGIGGNARFGWISGLVRAPGGDLYAADLGNATIRRITPSGAVTTLAGLAGVSGTADGRGSEARFQSLGNLTLTADGLGLMVMDNQRFRRVAWDGLVTTVDEFGYGNTTALAYAPSGDLWAANHVQGELAVFRDGRFVRVAGKGVRVGRNDGLGDAASFFAPTDLVLDATGNAFVTEVLQISKVTPDRMKTRFLGTVSSFLRLALHPSGDMIAAESQPGLTCELVRISKVDGAKTVLAGRAWGHADGPALEASFSDITGLAVAPDGTILVSQANHTIRKVGTDGVVTTLAGLPTRWDFADGSGADARFNQPNGIALDGAGGLLVADSNNHCIRRVDIQTGATTTLAGMPRVMGYADGANPLAARFNLPYSVALDAQGTIFVADAGNDCIRRIRATGAVDTVAGSPGLFGNRPGPLPGTLYFPIRAVPRPNGDLLVLSSHTLLQITAPQ
jgi:hypothetical protein